MRLIKKHFNFLPLFLVIPAVLAFQVQVSNFSAVYQGADIRLEWRVQEEGEVSFYDISRKKESESGYTKLADISKNGSGTYVWVDDNLYKDGEGMETLSYRLAAHTASGQPRFFYTTIQHSPTAVQRSWGSIKSMFR